MELKIEAKWTTDLESKVYTDALHIRHAVFIIEQGVSLEEEIDDLENQTEHLVVYENGQPVAAARMLAIDPQTYKAQRVSVLKDARGQGYGAELMQQMELRAKELGGQKITLGAQNTAIPFYEKLGYEVEGDEFLDAGIPHHTMSKSLP